MVIGLYIYIQRTKCKMSMYSGVYEDRDSKKKKERDKGKIKEK